MQLEEITTLPRSFVKNLNGDVGNLKVSLVQDFSLKLLKDMVNHSARVFGEIASDEWTLVPQIRHGNVYVLTNEDKNRVVGLAILIRDWEDPDQALLNDITIEEYLQGQGIGTRFLHSICQNLIEQGFKRMSLTVDVNNKPAIRVYRDKLGFEIVESKRHEYGEGEHRHLMILDLDSIHMGM